MTAAGRSEPRAGAAGGGGGPAGSVVVLASAPWETPAPVNAHHIARRLAARGHPVLFVESTGLRSPSLRSGHDRRRVGARLRRALAGPREAAAHLHVLSPLALPAGWPAPAAALSARWLAAGVRRAVRALGLARPAAVAFLPTWLPAARALHPARLVYYCVDRYAANPGVDRGRVEAAEARMLAVADRVVATSATLAAHLRERRPDVLELPNVADVARFARAREEALPEPPELAGRPRPRMLFLGNLAGYRVDFALLDALAERRPEASWVLVGAVGLGDPGGEPPALARLRRRPNVLLPGPRPHAELPAWLAHADVALIPFLDNEHTRASLPLKLWEYAAAGVPVVATALPALAPLAAAGIVYTASGVEGFDAALERARAEPPEGRARRAREARGHDWEARMDRLEEVFGLRPGTGDGVR